MADMKQHKLGWIGIGRMGYAMAERLAKTGCDISVWNRTRSKAEPLSRHGAKVVDSLSELAACDEEPCCDIRCEHQLLGRPRQLEGERHRLRAVTDPAGARAQRTVIVAEDHLGAGAVDGFGRGVEGFGKAVGEGYLPYSYLIRAQMVGTT